MTILGDAAKSLGISRTTLKKWCERLGIEPLRHEWDRRFYTITDEELQKIREARAQMPKSATTDA